MSHSETANHALVPRLDHDYPLLVRGEGVNLFDDRGNRYLDAASGVGVVNVGHGVREIVDAIAAQAQTLAFSYGVDSLPRRKLAAAVQKWSPKGMGQTRTLFCSGGAEANEGAIKLAYQYHWERGNRTKRKVISRWQSYHGNSIGALSLSGRTQWRKIHSPYLLDFPHIPPPYSYRYPGQDLARAKELERVIRQEGPEHIAAFIAEPVIGTTMSAIVPDPGYYKVIRDICDEYDILFIADEVMSGFGRTGMNFGIDHWNVAPDIITAGKGISGGYSPLSAIVLAEKVWQAMAHGSQRVHHSTTYGGNPLSCAAGVAVLQYLEDHQLVQRAGLMGEKLFAALKREIGSHPIVGDIRGKGLFIGIEFVRDKQSKEPFPPALDLTHRIVDQAFANGLLVLGGVTGLVDGIAGDHLEVIPPYIIDDEHVDIISKTLKTSIEQVASQPEFR